MVKFDRAGEKGFLKKQVSGTSDTGGCVACMLPHSIELGAALCSEEKLKGQGHVVIGVSLES